MAKLIFFCIPSIAEITRLVKYFNLFYHLLAEQLII